MLAFPGKKKVQAATPFVPEQTIAEVKKDLALNATPPIQIGKHARRYRRMAALYDIAGKRVALLLRHRDLEAARGVLVQLGREALAETCDWLLLHRERQIDVPTG